MATSTPASPTVVVESGKLETALRVLRQTIDPQYLGANAADSRRFISNGERRRRKRINAARRRNSTGRGKTSA